MIDLAVGIPLHEQIYTDLKRQISSGEIGYMQQIPTLRTLCKMYGVSDITVRRALDELAREGLIVKQRGRGRGTFAIKRLTNARIRVFTIAGFDIQKTPIEACHEMFDLLAGIHKAVENEGAQIQMTSHAGFNNLPDTEPNTGYLIIANTWEEYQEGARMAQEHCAPYVLVNPPASGYPCVRVDMEEGAFLGTSHLAQQGHRRIAYVGAIKRHWFAPRFAGYQRALALHGLAFDPALVVETTGIDPQQDWDALDYLLALPTPPTAIFACSDYRALHIMTHCKQRGVHIPADLSLCGYDNIRECDSVQPTLTTVHHPREELGELAVKLLIRLIAGEEPETEDIVVRPHLVVRQSCAELVTVGMPDAESTVGHLASAAHRSARCD